MELLDGGLDRNAPTATEGFWAPGRGNAFVGFRMEDCERVFSNSCDRVVCWKGSSDLSALRGRLIRLHVSMRNAKLYAFQFVD